MAEVFISTDVETDGPIPGPNSMLSLGAAAFVEPSPEPIAAFSVNLELLDGATPDPDTMRWWKEAQPEAWKVCRENPVAPAEAMERFVDWVAGLLGIETTSGAVSNAVFVGYPTGFDFTFTYWYIRRFGLQSPFSFSALDIKTFAMAVLGTGFRQSVKRNMPSDWFPKDRPHTHVAVDDAIEQGIVFMNMLAESRRQHAERSGSPSMEQLRAVWDATAFVEKPNAEGGGAGCRVCGYEIPGLPNRDPVAADCKPSCLGHILRAARKATAR